MKSAISSKILALSLALTLLLSGCGGGAASASASASAAQSAPAAPAASGVTVTDLGGRTVELPGSVKRISSLHPTVSYLSWRFAKDKMVSVDMVFEMSSLGDKAVHYFSQDDIDFMKGLEVTGTYFKNLNMEQLTALEPDLVLTLAGDPNADETSRELGCPVVEFVKQPLELVPDSFRLAGKVMGNAAEAEKLASYWSDLLGKVTAEGAAVPDGKKLRVFYTGKNGDITGTPTADTVFSECIKDAGGVNAGDELDVKGNESAEVNIEQVISWNPDLIIVATQAGKDAMMADKNWKNVPAVAAGRVYVPRLMGGLDGYQALLGCLWTQGILLHENDAAWWRQFDQTMKEYYQLFYLRTITDAEVAATA